MNWTYQASGPVKGGPALVHGILYFGDYDGRAYALERGHRPPGLGGRHERLGLRLRLGQLLRLAGGRLRARLHGQHRRLRVLVRGCQRGGSRWSTSTRRVRVRLGGGRRPARLGPTVFVGSYSGEFYAFNAQSGAVRWTYGAGGRISGSSTVVDGVVYFSDLGRGRRPASTPAPGASSFRFPDGAFTPVIADPHTIFLSGYDTIYELLPGR